MKYWQTPAFRKLQKEFYDHLKKEGFVDAERFVKNNDGEDLEIIQSAAAPLSKPRWESKIKREAHANYFKSLTIGFESELFPDEIDKTVMLMRCSGSLIKEICDELSRMGKKSHRQTVRFIIRRYEHKWGVRIWSETQLHPTWKQWKKPPTKS